MKKSVAIFLFFLIPAAQAQNILVHGIIHDSKRSPLFAVDIRLINLQDTTKILFTTTDQRGYFLFTPAELRQYRLEATYIGYQKIVKTISVDKHIMDLGTFTMTETPISEREVVIEGNIPAAVQNGDTTEYIARAFKTNPDAVVEDLVTKMPGITVSSSGTVSVGGETVQRVLVDGKPFFGDDPTLALRNLPAEVVEKIQVFDQMSDQAQFTGFDDGQSVKAMNVITRSANAHSEFGRFSAGYGDDDGRYIVGAALNKFDGDSRLSLVGLTNNVNQQNFTAQDVLGTGPGSNTSQRLPGGRRSSSTGGGGQGGRSPGSQFSFGGGGGSANSFSAAQAQGINTTNMIGGNYIDSLSSQVFAQGSYFFNQVNNVNDQTTNRQYYNAGSSGSLYDQQTDADSKNYNHRANARIVYTIDSSNSIIVTPQLLFQQNQISNVLDATSSLATNVPLSESQTNNQTDASGHNLTGHITLRHKFELPGRTLSLDFSLSHNQKLTTTHFDAMTQQTGDSTAADTSNDQAHSITLGYSISPTLTYTEPVTFNSQLQLTYNASYSRNTADIRTYNFNALRQQYSDFDTLLSNVYENEYITQSAGMGYRIREDGLNAMAGFSVQSAELKNDQTFPFTGNISKSFIDYLPNALLSLALGAHENLRVMYRASTRPPNITQLQNVINNSNPLLLTSGNLDLQESYTNSLNVRYSITTPQKARSMFLLLSATFTNEYIGNATTLATRDTVLSDGTKLAQGSQLTIPINLNGYANVRSFFTYGFPVNFLSSMLNLSTGLTYTHTPAEINSLLDMTNTYAITQGFTLGSNVSPEVDFTLAYSGSYNISRTKLQPDQNSNYYSHTASFKFNWIFWNGIVFRNELNSTVTNGLSNGYDQNILLWNMSFGKKFFSNQRGELKLGVSDMLGQNKSITRNITDTYTEDVRNTALTRYVMLTFTYTLR
ncbi:MAG: outer membrane beta-barrel protein [Bacteroidota bacterium]